MKRLETRLYDFWVRKTIQEDLALFSDYQHNRGIVHARQKFLDWMASPEGLERLAVEKGERSGGSPIKFGEETRGKVIITPVAIPGCGKTTISVALTKLFGFAHTQSDDVVPKGKKAKASQIFEGNVLKLLQAEGVKVVIADKCVVQ